MTGNVISVVDAATYVVLSKAKEHVSYGDLVGTVECMTLYPRQCTNRCRYNLVKLYIISNFTYLLLIIKLYFPCIKNKQKRITPTTAFAV
jgi:hypothetical protein